MWWLRCDVMRLASGHAVCRASDMPAQLRCHWAALEIRIGSSFLPFVHSQASYGILKSNMNKSLAMAFDASHVLKSVCSYKVPSIDTRSMVPTATFPRIASPHRHRVVSSAGRIPRTPHLPVPCLFLDFFLNQVMKGCSRAIEFEACGRHTSSRSSGVSMML